jgi:hypothetical protein
MLRKPVRAVNASAVNPLSPGSPPSSRQWRGGSNCCAASGSAIQPTVSTANLKLGRNMVEHVQPFPPPSGQGAPWGCCAPAWQHCDGIYRSKPNSLASSRIGASLSSIAFRIPAAGIAAWQPDYRLPAKDRRRLPRAGPAALRCRRQHFAGQP